MLRNNNDFTIPLLAGIYRHSKNSFMENGRTAGMNYGNAGYTYQSGIMEFYDSFGVDRQPGEILTPSVDDKRANGIYHPRQINYTISALAEDEDEDDDDDDDLDVDELDLDEDDDEVDDDVDEEALDPDLDITEDDDDDDDDII
jgi:hypothetical protein